MSSFYFYMKGKNSEYRELICWMSAVHFVCVHNHVVSFFKIKIKTKQQQNRQTKKPKKAKTEYCAQAYTHTHTHTHTHTV